MDDVRSVMAAINQAWRENRPRDMLPHLHPDVAMALPGFVGTVTGRDALLAGFDDFCANARVIECGEGDPHIDVVGDTAVLTLTFEMVYERENYRARSTGRDFWIFARQGGRWIAVWRTMMDLAETVE